MTVTVQVNGTRHGCGGCRWWCPKAEASLVRKGECRAAPPQLRTDPQDAVWPLTVEDEWCGHFQLPVQ